MNWFVCPICYEFCSITPISSIFDPEMKKYGGLWYCKFCNKYFTNYFLTFSQIEELKKEVIKNE
jgi:hypothetical protein